MDRYFGDRVLFLGLTCPHIIQYVDCAADKGLDPKVVVKCHCVSGGTFYYYLVFYNLTT